MRLFNRRKVRLLKLTIQLWLLTSCIACMTLDKENKRQEKEPEMQRKNIFLLNSSRKIPTDSIKHIYQNMHKSSIDEFQAKNKELLAEERYAEGSFFVYRLKLQDIQSEDGIIQQQIIGIVNEVVPLGKDTVLIMFPNSFSCLDSNLSCYASWHWDFPQKYDSLMYIDMFSQRIYFATEMRKTKPLRRAAHNAEIAQIDDLADSLLLVQIINHGGEENCGYCSYDEEGRAIFIYHKRTKSFCFLPSYEPRFFRSNRLRDYTKEGTMQVLALDSLYTEGDKTYERLRLFAIKLDNERLYLEALPWFLDVYTKLEQISEYSYHPTQLISPFSFSSEAQNYSPSGALTCHIDPKRSIWFEPLEHSHTQSKYDSLFSSYAPYPAYIYGE